MSAFLILRPTADEITKTSVARSLLSDLSMALMEIGEEERPRASAVGRSIRNAPIA
jgi:hypothetical protein